MSQILSENYDVNLDKINSYSNSLKNTNSDINLILEADNKF
jgi:hypothetical protein